MMNERIKELAERATSKMTGENNTLYDVLDAEKFAELIIRECASIVEAQTECLCDDKAFWSDQDYGYEMAVNDSVDMIKEYFGGVDKV